MTKRRPRTTFDADERLTMRIMAETNSRLTGMLEEAHRFLWRALGKSAITGDSSAVAPVLTPVKTNEGPAVAASENVATSRKSRKLTRRQREIVHLVMEGLSNEEIGERLHLSPDTIRSHRQNAYDRLGVHNVAELIAKKDEWE